MKHFLAILLIILGVKVYSQQYLYSQSSTANTWSTTLGGANCECSPTSTDTVEIWHNWANPAFYPLTHPANLAFGNFLSVNPAKVIVRAGGVAYQQPNLVTGMELVVNEGGFWAYNGSLVLDGISISSLSKIQNNGTVLVNGSYTNRITLQSDGEFCKNGAWSNDITAPGTFNGIADANMDPYFGINNYGAVCTAPIALPIELISFKVKEVDKSAFITWSTATEINNDYFVIERSRDAYKWDSIDLIEGAGNSSTVLDYSTIDRFPISGQAYYRLKQVDFNGDYSYSNIAAISLSKDFFLYPNPTKNSINVYYPYAGNITVSIYNSIGTLMIKEYFSTSLISGLIANIEVSLPNGRYQVLITTEDEIISNSFLISN